MPEAATNPLVLNQNRLESLIATRATRTAFYAAMLERRIVATASGESSLRVPAPRGLRRRMPGRPFHDDAEWFFQESGTLHFEFPEEQLTLRAGECGLVPAGMPHGERWSGRFLNVIYMAQPDGYSLHVGYLDNGMRCGPADRFYGPTEKLGGYAAELAASAPDAGARRLRQGLLLALLSRLREGLDCTTPDAAVERPLLRRCEDLLDAHFCRLDFSVEWLAANLGCTPDHLSRAYRRQHGRRLIESLHDRRVGKARALLRSTTLGVAEVAWACGYSSPSYFNRVFRLRTGQTPRDFAVAKVGADPRP